LRAQAKLWDPVSLALFDRLGLRPGSRVLEVGPGQGSLHMELRRRVAGPVDAVERSPVFAAHLETLAQGDGLGAGRTWQCDLIDAPLRRDSYDVIFARWVFLFLPHPLEHLQVLVRALKPGGRLALQDYLRGTFALVPSTREWKNFCAADLAFLASQGGDANIGARLPGLFRDAGLRPEETVATVKSGGPGSPVWSWLSAYFLGIMDRYADFPPFTREQAERLRRHWRAAAREKSSLLIAPAVLDMVGRKPRRAAG
jgi:SAM-dependent methyltransferase